MNSIKEQVAPLLQDPQQCCTILELCMECTGVVGMLPPNFQERLTHSFQTTSPSIDGIGTPSFSKISISSVQPLA
jgi:hypothetical protein